MKWSKGSVSRLNFNLKIVIDGMSHTFSKQLYTIYNKIESSKARVFWFHKLIDIKYNLSKTYNEPLNTYEIKS